MIQFNKVGHVMIGVRDLKAATEFYTQLLGMEVVNTFGTGDMKVAFLSFGNSDHDMALIQVPEDQMIGSPAFTHIALELEGGLDELNDFYVKVKNSGVKVEMTANHISTKSFYFQDPDGNRLEAYIQALDSKSGKEVIRNARRLDDLLQPLELGVQ